MMLTVRGEEEDLVRALDLGADDYLTKPFSPRTLLARIKALMRRAGMESSAPLAAGRISLDLDEHTVRIGAADPVRLTKLELRLLQMLLAHAGRTVSSDRLLVQVWGHRNGGDRQLLEAAGAPAAAEDRVRSGGAGSCCRPRGVGLQAGGRVTGCRCACALAPADLVEHAAVAEVRPLLQLRPAAEVGDRAELQLREVARHSARRPADRAGDRSAAR